MKRKATVQLQAQSRPISAIAARKAKQRLAEVEQSPAIASPSPVYEEPPLKKARASAPPKRAESAIERKKASRQVVEVTAESISTKSSRRTRAPPSEPSPVQATEDVEDTEDASISDGGSASTSANSGAENSSETQTVLSQNWEDFSLSRSRLGKGDVVHVTVDSVCLRLKLKATLVVVGQYDLWVKRGVVSVLGAKLHPSPRLYRVYAPSTHSLPVIKCVSVGPDGYAEIEVRSCDNGLFRLEELSDTYERIWNGQKTIPKKKLKCDGKASFSVLYSTSDDELGRHLRPLHNAKQWGFAMKALSQRGGNLRVLTCGPKGSGKSTFNKYLLNHLLSVPPQDMQHPGKDGVAFLDLDPGQPEFSPAGHIYLAHIKSPVLGPPYSHPTLNEQTDGRVVRSHHIGATSPKDDSDHYAIAIMDLMDRYHQLRHQYPQCALIINYPGWIFGQGLEIATWLVGSLGLSDLVYMSEKGPEEVVVPLGAAASQAGVPLTILPSQPIEYASRSSSQLRSMQMLSYFHTSQGQEKPVWSDTPLSRSRSMIVNYAGDKQGVFGIMTPGFSREPDMLRDLLDGAIVGVVALESLDAVGPAPQASGDHETTNPGSEISQTDTTSHPNLIRTESNLPYLFLGSGTCMPPDPKKSYSLGLALVRAINTESQSLELITPIPASTLRTALDQNHRIVLVRGHLDNPNWAISEEYFAARAALGRCRERSALEKRVQKIGEKKQSDGSTDAQTQTHREDGGIVGKLRERVRLAADVPWMKVEGWDGLESKTRRERRLWKVRKRAGMPDSGGESES